MNSKLLEKINVFLSESSPESILNECHEYGCNIQDTNILNSKLEEIMYSFNQDITFELEESFLMEYFFDIVDDQDIAIFKFDISKNNNEDNNISILIAA
ncbi:hypothetical protein SDC9_111378 [bioreactor metagenome]|uniref:Uncharacterized protein n=1 Tax=bioreactor metagenome TaxID=1076179 RepID=A0A645BIU9_9ZZZZ